MPLNANAPPRVRSQLTAPAATPLPLGRPRCAEIVKPAGGVCYETASRAMNLLLALLLLAFSWPLMVLAIALVKLTSRGPVLYSQTRVGRRGKPFRLYKIRTMLHDCERTSGPRWCSADDARVLPIGRFLRRTHVDELPQLWNILRGDMSLVGPRPERPEFVPQLEQVIPYYRDRLTILPGLTGLAQVHLPPDTNLASVHRKLAYDVYYVRQRSLWLDLRLLAATFCQVFLPFGSFLAVMRIPTQQVVEAAYQSLL
jgi:lipopolysaccharide/colanic/teichoic acid biosynthesis glycosyltransferase